MKRACVAFAAALSACAELPPIEDGACGNGVLDSTEQCDTVEDPSLGPGTSCGAAGSVGACRYVCDGDGDPACPIGWACAPDGICRHASGEFERGEGSPWSMASDELEVGDVDGDGSPDAIGFSSAQVDVRFGSREGLFTSLFTRNTDFRQGRPALHDVDHDQRLDLVIPIAAGLTGMLGQADRSMAPIVYGAFDVGALDGFVMLPPRPADRELPLVLFTDDVGASWMRVRDELGAVMGPPVPFPGGASLADVVWPIPTVDLAGDGGRQFALPIAFSQELVIYRLAELGGGAVQAEPMLTVTLPDPLLFGARFADVDGDGRIDLMASISRVEPLPNPTECSGPETYDKVAVIYAIGESGVSDAVVEPLFDFMRLSCCSDNEWPLAVVDVDRATQPVEAPDFVGKMGICVRSADSLVYVGGARPGQYWSEAAAADFNRDGHVDLAGSDGNGIDFLFGNDTGLYTLYRSNLPTAPLALRTGDFDGDFFADAAVALETFRPDGTLEGSVAVLYGSVQGGPTPPVITTRTGRMYAMEPADLTGDLSGDLVIKAGSFQFGPVGEEGPLGGGTPSIAFLKGSSQRGMVSPLVLQAPEGKGADTPIHVSIGRLGPTPDDHGDIVAFAFRPRADEPEAHYVVWLLEGDQNGQFNRSSAASGPIDGALIDVPCTHWVAGDLDGDPATPETLIGVDNACGARVDGVGNVAPSRLLSATVIPTGPGAIALDTVVAGELAGELRVPSRASLADVNGDGLADLIVVFGSFHTTDPGSGFAGAGGIEIYVNVAGAIEPEQHATIDRFALSDGSELPSLVWDARPLNADGDAQHELAILGDWGVFLADPDASFAFPSPARLIVQEPTPWMGSVRAADVNRDGLSDLVFSGMTGVHVYTARQAIP